MVVRVEFDVDGIGVKPEAVEDAFSNPVRPPKYDPSRDTWRYEGENAIVVVNRDGDVLTVWAKHKPGRLD